MAEHIKRIERKLVYQGNILGFYEDTMQTPDGKIAKWVNRKLSRSII